MSSKLEEIRKRFPITQSCAYVNHAAVGALSVGVKQAMVEQIDSHVTDVHHSGDWYEAVSQQGRTLAGKLVNCPPDRIAYIQNTSHGVFLAADGLDWREGDNVIVPQMEFPSNYLVWKNLAAQGVELRHFPADNGRLTPETLQTLIDARTRVVTLSHVQFYNGFRADLAAFADICRQYDALLIVDGTQSIGAISLDMERCGVDILIVSAHKWMLGPMGIGFMALSERAFACLTVNSVGWLSVNDPYQFRREIDLLPTAERFEPGTRNRAGIFGLAARLHEIDEAGIVSIEQRIFALNDRVYAGILPFGFQVTSPWGNHERSGIMTVNRPGVSSQRLHQKLADAGVVASVRLGAIRLSPHYYNSEEEIDLTINILSTL